MQLGFTVEVVAGLAQEFETDVLMIKHAPHSSGLGSHIRKALKTAGDKTLSTDPPNVGEYRLVQSPSDFKSSYVLSVGTVSVFYLDYAAIRRLGHDLLASLHDAGLDVAHVATTLHGVNTGLNNDEEEAFRSLLLGFADAYEAGRYPPNLERLTIVEREPLRVKLLQEALARFLPPQAARRSVSSAQQTVSEALMRPLADENTPHVFVAMPFAEEFDDQYYLAIRPAVTENSVLCIRLDVDENAFSGDIMEQVKKRIQTAQLVIALLDTRNPNVYLEVGYAWGVGTPTILILHEDEEPPFDVQGARLLKYKRIHKLKELLSVELRDMLR